MKVLITGSNGFIGGNLQLHLAERKNIEIRSFSREQNIDSLTEMVRDIDIIFHLAGVNRPVNIDEFKLGNVDLTLAICSAITLEIARTGKKPKLIYTSSIQASADNEYGISKRLAEEAVFELNIKTGVDIYVYRLPNVFGKWAKPNYNSVVATFCHNISRGLPIRVDDSEAIMHLLYVEDLIQNFLYLMDGVEVTKNLDGFVVPEPIYQVKVGEIAKLIKAFKKSQVDLLTDCVGSGLIRALYSTYVSYLPVESFSYSLPRYSDTRGIFVEVLKTSNCGQFSYFTAGPGITRGGHYHHTKTEKFLIIKGRACFKFKNMHSNQYYELVVSDEESRVVETIPGWAHDITNIGNDELIVMLWANEIFDRSQPDTFSYSIEH
ncbi:NAD-dependent epimerase/dehydratase family protein [Polynucleobacter sp. AP-Feld-500C-C5]|uniref:UDP-2-acetamido-2,6-beta-L-arabino-hexul-4-ose reductase n=1 Tax=Polynucleobacter sp. AP-Feld-500C-C5 TaxID=2576924 RepID=UPI001C0E5941|nr:NAD-dependent epimerase/dehydratase family protein [Polynucleobacter sp. AP-Feld-500C-C5]MBU3632902.1 SDR family oxidoreductase [Polynucleobacter sp. AP-Feld-500C-C5]